MLILTRAATSEEALNQIEKITLSVGTNQSLPLDAQFWHGHMSKVAMVEGMEAVLRPNSMGYHLLRMKAHH